MMFIAWVPSQPSVSRLFKLSDFWTHCRPSKSICSGKIRVEMFFSKDDKPVCNVSCLPASGKAVSSGGDWSWRMPCTLIWDGPSSGLALPSLPCHPGSKYLEVLVLLLEQSSPSRDTHCHVTEATTQWDIGPGGGQHKDTQSHFSTWQLTDYAFPITEKLNVKCGWENSAALIRKNS